MEICAKYAMRHPIQSFDLYAQSYWFDFCDVLKIRFYKIDMKHNYEEMSDAGS